MFGRQSLKDQLFCAAEERDYFQSKYLEQVSEIALLKEQLAKSQAEIRRLRSEVMNTSLQSERSITDEKKQESDNDSVEDEDSIDETSRSSQHDIRQNAAKLLQWADYRQRTPIKSPSQGQAQSCQEEDYITDVDIAQNLLQKISVADHDDVAVAPTLSDEDLTDDDAMAGSSR